MFFLQEAPNRFGNGYAAYYGIGFLVMALGFAVLWVLIYVLIVRWVFRINTHVRNQRTMIELLIKLCRRNGVPEEELYSIKAGENIVERRPIPLPKS
jgi:hypothetical protein